MGIGAEEEEDEPEPPEPFEYVDEDWWAALLLMYFAISVLLWPFLLLKFVVQKFWKSKRTPEIVTQYCASMSTIILQNSLLIQRCITALRKNLSLRGLQVIETFPTKKRRATSSSVLFSA